MDKKREVFRLNVTIKNSESYLLASLSGEIDHHTAKAVREAIDDAIGRFAPKKLVLDFRDVSFMDSSGIGLVMGRYKLMRENDGSLSVANLTGQQKKVMKLAGLDKLVTFEEVVRQ